MQSDRQRGGTLLEAALVSLLLFTLLFAILEFGRIFNLHQTLTNAAREGARFAVAPCQSGDPGTSCSYGGVSYQNGANPSEAAVVKYVTTFLNAAHVHSPTVTAQGEWEPFSGSANNSSFNVLYRVMRVEVSAPYQWSFFPFPQLTLRASSVMKDEVDMQQ